MTENILDPGGQIIASKRFDDDGDLATPYEYADQYFFYHYDMRGSVTNIVGPDGELITGYEYDEFGNRQQSGDTSFLNEVTFTSSVSDLSTGLQYMNARYYDSRTGRFLSQDTYTGNAYESWTQHLYSYCGNNPVNMIDPTGHTPKYISSKDYKNQLDGLKKDLKFYEKMCDGYYNNIQKSSGDMKRLYQLGLIRNSELVAVTESQIKKLKEQRKLSAEYEKNLKKEAVKHGLSMSADAYGLTGTANIGINGSGSAGYGVTGGLMMSTDFKGNVAYQSYSGDTKGLPSASGTLFFGFTNAPNVDKTFGKSVQRGGSINVYKLLGVGVDYVTFNDEDTGKPYYGVTVHIGISGSLFTSEAHVDTVNTKGSTGHMVDWPHYDMIF